MSSEHAGEVAGEKQAPLMDGSCKRTEIPPGFRTPPSQCHLQATPCTILKFKKLIHMITQTLSLEYNIIFFVIIMNRDESSMYTSIHEPCTLVHENMYLFKCNEFMTTPQGT